MNSVIAIDVDNLEAHIVRFAAYIQTKNYEKCHQEHDYLLLSLRARGLLLVPTSSNPDSLELNESNLKRFHKLSLPELKAPSKPKKGMVAVSSNSTDVTDESTIHRPSPITS